MSDRLLKESDVIEVVTQYISCDYPTEEMAREDAEVLIGRTPSADRPQDDCSTCEHYNDVGDWCKTCGVSHYTPRMKGADDD